MNTTSACSRQIPAAIEDAAAEWLVRRQAGLAPTDAALLDAWLAADPLHRTAFAAIETTWSTLSFPRAVGQAVEAKRQLVARAQLRRRGRLKGALVGASFAAALAVVWMFPPARFSSVSAVVTSSVTPRPNVQSLPDGSTIELNAAAEISVDFSATQRAVHLVSGEALFAVQKDPSRPFVVTAGGIAVRAVGTAFAVRHASAAVGVIVTEGQVAIARINPVAAPAGSAGAPIFIAAGGSINVPADPALAPVVASSPLSAPELAAELAWRGRRVEFTQTTLAEAAALFNGQNRVQIAIAEPAVGRIALSGIFWADDPESFVRLIEAGFNIQAHRTIDRIELRGR